jgi:hypothetical protein
MHTIIGLIASALATAALASTALAHGDADWINQGGWRNAVGELCYGERDCAVVPGVRAVSVPAPGYRLPDGEFVPQSEALPSPDGQFWRCVWGGERKCFFAPPMGF